MPRLLALLVAIAVVSVVAAGCGTVFNNHTAIIHLPPGATLDGYGGPTVEVSQQLSHMIVYPDGRRCLVESGYNILFIVGDVLLFLFPVVVDAITGDWRVLDAGNCPGLVAE